jgi:hypothetical protein
MNLKSMVLYRINHAFYRCSAFNSADNAIGISSSRADLRSVTSYFAATSEAMN